MTSIDVALEKCHESGKPVQVALVGAGTLGRMIALQFLTPIHGMRLSAISNRTAEKAQKAYVVGGITTALYGNKLSAIEETVSNGGYVITEDASLVCRASGIDIIIEATGTVEYGSQVVTEAIKNGKHVIVVNAELDSTLGPILKQKADLAGVVYSNTDGDEPGVAMNLVRYLKTIGYRPVAAGNLKGMIDCYRTPETQRVFAEKYNQNPKIVTSFADGTKLSMEETVLANATGFKVGKRGMHGPSCDHVKDIIKYLPPDQMLNGGLVDYALGAAPYTGAFVVVYEDHPVKQSYLSYLKMGEGPFYVFYTPYHLPHVQIVSSVARAVLANDPTVAAEGGPICEVITMAKRDLKTGDTLDGIGGFNTYGVIENSDIFVKENLLPIGISEDCKLKRDIKKDEAFSYDDVELPSGRLCDMLRIEQNEQFKFSMNNRER